MILGNCEGIKKPLKPGPSTSQVKSHATKWERSTCPSASSAVLLPPPFAEEAEDIEEEDDPHQVVDHLHRWDIDAEETQEDHDQAEPSKANEEGEDVWPEAGKVFLGEAGIYAHRDEDDRSDRDGDEDALDGVTRAHHSDQAPLTSREEEEEEIVLREFAHDLVAAYHDAHQRDRREAAQVHQPLVLQSPLL